MATYLLTWDAKPTEMNWFKGKMEKKFVEDPHLEFKWSVGNTKKIKKGDRALFLQQAYGNRGLLGYGEIIREPYYDEHFTGAKRKAALYVKIDWEYFTSEALVSREELDEGPFNQVH